MSHWPALQAQMQGLSAQEVSVLHQLFRAVVNQGRFVQMTDATPAPPGFRMTWNSLSVSIRDEVSQSVASVNIQAVETLTLQKMRSETEAVQAAEARARAEAAEAAW